MGAICPGRWHDWHLAWRMGRISVAKESILVGDAGSWERTSMTSMPQPAANAASHE